MRQLGIFLAVDSEISTVENQEIIQESTESTQFQINWDEYIGINSILPKIPEINIPEINTPEIASINLEQLNFNADLSVPTINTELTTINTESKINMIDTASEINIVDTESEINMVDSASEINTVNINEEELLAQVPVVYDYSSEIKTAAKNLKLLQKYFKDERNLVNDAFISSKPYVNKWIEIYEKYTNKSFKTINQFKKFRMISEVRLPKSANEFNILRYNLTYYKINRIRFCIDNI